MTSGSGMLTCDDFLKVFRKVGIKLSSSENDQIKNFFEFNMDRNTHTLTLQTLFNFFEMTDRLLRIKNLLKEFFSIDKNLE